MRVLVEADAARAAATVAERIAALVLEPGAASLLAESDPDALAPEAAR